MRYAVLRKWTVVCLPLYCMGAILARTVAQQVINTALTLNAAECQAGIVFKARFNQLVVLLVS